ncbi:MAG TPA: adenylate/guanylate cyclase domain-containing protein, partial [Candidatus Limnocylindrales bacterium]|nr:adenylate/guanylate cyclase domain-containing protein [Candidatus Limnocylindrales bacterium]
MVTCPNCGTANPEAARFCMACGHVLAAPTPSREARKVVTVVFADITGSTGLGERLDPESLRAIMGRWFEAMREVLEHHGGTVEKFIGDAVVAVFGVPVLHEDDALRAVRAAAGMQAALDGLNEALRAERDLEIAMRVGVNTGQVVVGDARAGGSRATGDAVNVAARLQQAAEPGETLVGDSTWRLVRDAVVTGEPRDVQVKGREEPVVVRTLIDVDQTAEAIHRRVGGPMVGRDRELGILRAAYERSVVEERCVLVTVLGSAGVGKSRLVHEFLAGTRAGSTVLRGRCLPYGQGITWYPVAELLRSAVGLDEEADPSVVMDQLRERLAGVTDAEAVLARLAEPLGVATEPAPVEELFWAFRRFLERLATGGPVVLVLDDLQWAESTLLDLVEHLSEWVHGVPLFLLAMARPELLDLRVGWGGGKPDATTFLLEPLPAADTEHLVEALLEGGTVPAAARARIAAAADGNPLYVEQVIEMLLDDGHVRRLPDGSLEIGDLESISVPPTIQALLAARLDRLSDSERRTIERAAVVGKEFGQREVSELTPADGRAGVSTQLMALVRKELIRPDRRRDDGGETYRFRHLLIRDAAYDSLPKAERAELHEHFADWLELTAADRIADLDEIMGYHLDQARTYRLALGPEDGHTRTLGLRAGRRLAAAGRRAADRDEVAPAIRLLTRAEALLIEDPPARFETLLQLVSVGFAEDYAVTMQVALRLEAVAAMIGELATRRARLWVSSVRSMTDPGFALSETRAEAESAALAFASAGDIDAILDAYQALILVDLNLAHWQDTATSARLGFELAREAGRDRRREDFAGWWSNALLWGSTDAAQSLATIDGLLGSISRRLSRSNMLSSVAVLRGVLGDRPGADAAHVEAAAIREELGLQPAEFRRAYMEYALDDFPAAIRFARAAAVDLERRGDTGQRSTILALEGWILALMGEDDEAARLAAESRQLTAPDDAVSQILWRTAESVVLAR